MVITARLVVPRTVFARVVLLGLATGARTLTGLAATTVSLPAGARRQPERALARPVARALVGTAASLELVGDKLPGAPSRLAASGLVPRLVVSAGLAVLVARRAVANPGRDSDVVEPGPAEAEPPSLPPLPPPARVPPDVAVLIPTAVLASLAGGFLGTRWRAWASRRFGCDTVGALIEDVVAVVLACAATRH